MRQLPDGMRQIVGTIDRELFLTPGQFLAVQWREAEPISHYRVLGGVDCVYLRTGATQCETTVDYYVEPIELKTAGDDE